MSTVLFDLSDQYDAMLDQGLGLSGERRQYFIEGRIEDLKTQLRSTPRRILDFGCGTGEATAYLAKTFPDAEVVGVDVSEPALEYARVNFGTGRVSFKTVGHTEPGSFDLCYVNGVFHHIPPPGREDAALYIYEALAPGGQVALFENNPWNPGTRMVMRRIPFDRDAVMLSPRETRRLVRRIGFAADAPTRFLFYLPHSLRFLRFLEPHLVNFPLGGQYYVLASKHENE